METTQAFGPFTLLQKIADGGMAVTWLARLTSDEPGRELVIKRILPELAQDAELRDIFVEEMKIAERLEHDNVVRTFDAGEADGEYYIAMEYIWGEDLRRIVERSQAIGKALPLPLVVDIIARAARGLWYAHNLHDEQARPIGLVHRDISPPNLMVGYDGSVKVVDFGIARAEAHYMAVRPGQLKGKYSYMSPEQVQGLEVDHRSDIFSLGIILYELTTRRRLFRAESDVETIKLVKDARIEAPQRVRADYPPRLAEIVEKALARSPEDRYRDAAAFADALEAFLKETRSEVSPAQLSRHMTEIFPDRIEELEEVLGEGYKGPVAPPRIPRRPKPAPAKKKTEDVLDAIVAPKAAAVSIEDLAPVEDDDLERMRSSGRWFPWAIGGVAALLAAWFVWGLVTEGSGTAYLDGYDAGPSRADMEYEAIERPAAPPVISWRVASDPPGAWIIVNGVATRQQTPAEVPLVQDALNTIMLVQDGFRTLYHNVDVGSGPQELTLALQRIEAPADWTPPPPVEGEPPVTAWTQPMGRIRIEAEDANGQVTGAEVLRNGERIEGGTPVEVDVPAREEQHFTIRLAGHRDAVAVVRAPVMRNEADTRVIRPFLTLSRGEADLYTSLRLQVNPANAIVTLNDEERGTMQSANLTAPLHHVVRIAVDEHEPMVRALDAKVGTFQLVALLDRVRRDPSHLTFRVEPGDTQIFARDLRLPPSSATQIGRGAVEARVMDSGTWEITLSRSAAGQRQRARFELVLEPGQHHTFQYALDGDEATEVSATQVALPPAAP